MRIITTDTPACRTGRQIINVANVAEFRLFHYTSENYEGKTSKKFPAVEVQYMPIGAAGEYFAIVDYNDPQADNIDTAEDYFDYLKEWLSGEVGEGYNNFTDYWNWKHESYENNPIGNNFVTHDKIYSHNNYSHNYYA
ncbi:MAG: hypothetical protein FWG64_00840 [Firmicutes bacterium]|nr:hypothetical protein [Bacillota bacterium]